MAEEIKVLNKNTLHLVGTLVEVKNFRDENSKTGKPYASATYVIKSVIDGKENVFEVRSFSMASTSTGATSKKYTNIIESQKWVGSRVSVRGSIKENRFWSSQNSRVMSRQELDGSIYLANSEEQDTATFEVSGYVFKELVELVNKDEKPYIYRMSLGQYDYAKDNVKHLTVITLDLPITETIKANAIKEAYAKGDTITIAGRLNSIQTVTEQKTETVFGDPIVKKYTNTTRTFEILQGTAPLDFENGAAYTVDLINELERGYAAAEVEISNAEKDKVSSGMATTASTVTTSVRSKSKLFG